MADPVEMTVVQVRGDDRWLTVAALDGRRYPDRESFDRAVWDARDTLAEYRVPAQFTTRDVAAEEPPSPLPSWEEYRAGLVAKGAGGTA